MATKTLDDIRQDMSELYEKVRKGSVDLKVAAELTNITGKHLKAIALDLAIKMFVNEPRELSGPQ